MVALLTFAMIDYRVWIDNAWLLFALILLMLVLVLIPHVGIKILGARRWLGVGSASVQPAELTKPVMILMLAWLFCKVPNRGIKICFQVIALLVVPAGLILLQPDLGSASVLFPIAFVMMYVAGVRKRYLAVPVIAVVGIILFTYYGVYLHGWRIHGLHDYQMERIRVFFDPSRDPLNRGWTIKQSLIAIGSGGFHGKGFHQGTQNMLGFLPRNISYNDFIFAVIGEDWGFVGCSSVILGIFLVIALCVSIAARAEDNAGAFLAAGFATLLFTHFFVNVGMTIQVVPITGIPLPFTSYGGTFLTICLAGIGLMQSVWIHRRVR
jgi:rod shape determining protein RodA